MNKTFKCKICQQELDIEKKIKSREKICKPCHNNRQKEYRIKKKHEIEEIKQGIKQEPPLEIPQIENESPKKEVKKEVKKEIKDKPSAKDIKEIKSMASAVLQAGFGILGTRAGEHWNISEDEAKSISSPLVNILNKYDLFQKVSKNSDALSLVVAVGTVIIPRSMIQYELIKQKRKEKKENEKRGGKHQQSNNTEKQSYKPGTKKTEVDTSNVRSGGGRDTPDSYVCAATGKEFFEPTTSY